MISSLKREIAAVRARNLLDRPPSSVNRARSHFLRHELAYGLAVVFFVALTAVALTVQGWRSRIPTFDLVTYIESAHKLLAHGTSTCLVIPR